MSTTNQTPSQGKKSTKGKGKRHPQHICTNSCNHLCGESGGRKEDGSPCGRRGAWGVKGKRTGSLSLCRDHDPSLSDPVELAFDGLTFKQARFVVAFCGEARGNATEAASIAGYSGDRQALAVAGSELLRNSKVRAAIDQRFEELSMPGSEVIARMTSIARLEADAMRALIKIDPTTALPTLNLSQANLDRYGHLIKEIKTDPETGHVIEVKLHDAHSLALRANTEMAKIRQLYTDHPVVSIGADATVHIVMPDNGRDPQLHKVPA